MSNEDKKSLAQSLGDFIQRFRFVFLGLVLVLALGSIGIVVYTAIRNQQVAEASASYDRLLESYDAVLAAADADRDARFTEFSAKANELRSAFAETYQAQRSWVLEGNALFFLKKYTEAEKVYLNALEVPVSEVLSAAAIFNAAGSAELAGRPADAKVLFVRLVDQYRETSPEVPRSLFNIGRLLEAEGDAAGAKARYQEIIDGFDDTDWTKLAKDRILFLETSVQ